MLTYVTLLVVLQLGLSQWQLNRQFTNANGDREADFINCVIWRKSAENFANFTKKGSLVGVDGRLQLEIMKINKVNVST